MMEEPTVPGPVPAVNPLLDRACDIAAGCEPADGAAEGATIRAAHKDLNCRGRGPWWYRMVYRSGAWSYFSDERLPMGTFRAAERRATVYGTVYLGELVCSHDKGGPLDDVWLVIDTSEKPLRKCEHIIRRDGQLAITLPCGTILTVPSPRRR